MGHYADSIWAQGPVWTPCEAFDHADRVVDFSRMLSTFEFVCGVIFLNFFRGREEVGLRYLEARGSFLRTSDNMGRGRLKCGQLQT